MKASPRPPWLVGAISLVMPSKFSYLFGPLACVLRDCPALRRLAGDLQRAYISLNHGYCPEAPEDFTLRNALLPF